MRPTLRGDETEEIYEALTPPEDPEVVKNFLKNSLGYTDSRVEEALE